MKRNFWPYAIILYFAIFITGVVVWITFATRNDQQLVRADYYEQELKYQTELDGRSRALNADVTVAYDATAQRVTVGLPGNVKKASAYFYRPSNAKLDRELTLALDAGSDKIDVRDFQSGLWKLRLTWMAAGVEYRRETVVVLEPSKSTSL